MKLNGGNYLDEEEMVCFREKIIGDGRYFATKGNARQLYPPLSVNPEPECKMQAAERTCLLSEYRFEVLKGNFLVCHDHGWL